MAIKKSELYSSLWASCDELRGGMDASQYKDYVLTMLFVKYISDKYKNDPFGAITVPAGASFDDMVDLIGNTAIGDKINKLIIEPIWKENKLGERPDFNDESKLGKGKDLVDTVSNLVRIFNDSSLDFSGNTAEGDDILGDAYEYLMRHFATESGKSKGQFYTPAEVSRVLAKVIGINPTNSTNQTSAYDPTCGSGSLLLKVANESGKDISLYGQEKETTTANLARMNMILHNSPTAIIVADNTLSRPAYKETDGSLKRFDYVVANPPFSLKSWSNGVSIDSDEYNRFTLGVPPEKNGDYAFLLHIITSLKTTGKAAVVLPHGVLFRGNAEGEIRKSILKKGYIKGIIGLPANLFYGTGIPACIIVLDKEHAAHRKGIFMVDASKGFVKDGNKNRLREQDIRKITDVFTIESEIPKYSRMVSITEIADAKNDYNLNIPRYIDTQEAEDIQNIEAHLKGGIPEADVLALSSYWQVFPTLKNDLFQQLRTDFLELKVPASELKTTILNHPEFKAFDNQVKNTFNTWLATQMRQWQSLEQGVQPKQVIDEAGQSLLAAFADNALLDTYDIYQHLMSYWNDTMQDDVYSLAIDGWKAGNEYERLVIKGKKGKDGKSKGDKEITGLAGIEGRMITPNLLISVYFTAMQLAIQEQEAMIETAQARMTEIEEEQSSEEGLFADLEKVNATEIGKLLKQLKPVKKVKVAVEETYGMVAESTASYGVQNNFEILEEYLLQDITIKGANAKIKKLNADLEKAVLAKYPALSESQIKELVLVHKWQAYLENAIQQEQERISQNLTKRIKELAERYATTLSSIDTAANDAAIKVKSHLEKMGCTW
ncbi:type I restriction-modification system subunit M [Myroides odoratimimus]|uniref:type I restriction-modification system subunit M n=1 Tax=Myroides odoratimimus TaxID=76832 RepID=UPI0025761749|nr:type I restriction-modification system subunit M [Myroides odoratimimus]MDM1410733.1 type I restriction-modification system subunit M [Myroides odoratimimus]MDM1519367.1 type I restriction-modification system subunit M [Myroides odoratimimus]MEC4007685.1 type I restriction-modification system subunit M [Myroides odoratimimus]